MEGKSLTLEVREKNEGLNIIKRHEVVRMLSIEALSRAQGRRGVQISEPDVRFRVRARTTCGHELGLGKPKYVLHID